MLQRRFRRMTVLTLIVLAFGVSACVGSGTSKSGSTPAPGSSQAPAPANEPVKLRVWITGPNYQAWLEEQIKAFEAANPNIKVEGLALDWGSYQQKILTSMAGGGAPDLVSVYSVDVAPFVDQGVFQSIEGMVDKSLFVDRYLSSGTFNGKLYAVPLGMKVRPLYYRTDLLKDAGFSAPPKTYSDLIKLAKATTKKDAAGNTQQVGFWVPTDHPYKTVQVWWVFLLNNGGRVFDDSGKPAFNSPEGVAATQLFVDLMAAGVDVPGTIKTDNVDWQQGKVANIVSNIVTRNLMKDSPAMAEKLGMAVPPYGKKPVIELSGEVLGMTTKTTNKEAAAKLLNFLATREDAVVGYLKADPTSIPGLRSAQNNAHVKSDKFLTQMTELGNTYGEPLPSHPQWTQINDALKVALTEAWTGKKTAKAALDEAAAKVEKLLK